MAEPAPGPSAKRRRKPAPGPRIELVAVHALAAAMGGARPPAPDVGEARAPAPDAPAWLAIVRELFLEYAQQLGVDLCFQNFEQELAALPGDYAEPAGALWVALVDGKPAGCGAFRPLADVDHANACEMKRLYVRPAFRRHSLGRLLARALMDGATQAGYSCMLLDTLDDMEAARSLYESLGFVEVAPYYYNPLPGAHYLKVDLGEAATRV